MKLPKIFKKEYKEKKKREEKLQLEDKSQRPTKRQREIVDQAFEKTIKEYGEVLRKLATT